MVLVSSKNQQHNFHLGADKTLHSLLFCTYCKKNRGMPFIPLYPSSSSILEMKTTTETLCWTGRPDTSSWMMPNSEDSGFHALALRMRLSLGFLICLFQPSTGLFIGRWMRQWLSSLRLCVSHTFRWLCSAWGKRHLAHYN